jgi:hypothetical protein
MDGRVIVKFPEKIIINEILNKTFNQTSEILYIKVLPSIESENPK